MHAKLQRRIQRYGWDKAVGSYEHSWQHQLAPAQTRLLKMAALRPGERVLDVACGTGLVTCRAARQVGEHGTVVGVDVAGKMVAYAQQAAANQHLPQITWARMDAEELLLADATFDVALCALGLMYVPHPVKALQEMHRVLQPGGRAVAAVWGRRQHCGWADIFPIVDARVTSEVCPLFFHLGTPDMLVQTFAAAGFAHMISQRLSTTMAYASPEAACDAAFAGGPVALAYSRFDAATRAAVHADYLASIAPYRLGNGYEIPGEFVIVRAQKPCTG
jgi:ubiquinone/menaquinone biosynthesis C-methylase UbiE